MYSFFDTYDLIRHMAAGEPKEDSLLVLGNYEEIKKMVPQHNRLIGWGLVGFGVWALYETFISTWLYTLLCNLMGNGYAYDIIRGIPNVVIAALLFSRASSCWVCTPKRKTATMSFRRIRMNNYAFPLGGEAAPQRRMGDSLTDAARPPFAAG